MKKILEIIKEKVWLYRVTYLWLFSSIDSCEAVNITQESACTSDEGEQVSSYIMWNTSMHSYECNAAMLTN